MTTPIKSNSNLIQPFVVHPDATTLPKEKILEMQQSSEILKENACAILEVNVKNLSKMQEDFVIPKGSVIEYGASQFHPWIMGRDWNNPLKLHSPEASYNFDQMRIAFPERTATIIIPIEPQEGSDFCFKGDEESQEFKQAWFRDGFRGPLAVDYDNKVVDDGLFVANFHALNLLPFGFDVSEVQEDGVKEVIFTDLDKAIYDAEVQEMEAQEEYEKTCRLTESLKNLKYILENLSAQGIEVEVKIKK